ncbi:MAG: chemotaxis protein CheW [Sedimentisphaerales bacterium]|nr:chemotaxis protein CheW [Sedimentisphaerales bacterium]
MVHPNSSNSSDQSSGEHHVTTFTATENESGFQIMIAGCMKLHSASNMPRFVRGTITLKGNNIPIVDLDARAGMSPKDLSDDACVILFEKKKGGRTVAAGALYKDVAEVLDLVRKEHSHLDRDRLWSELAV